MTYKINTVSLDAPGEINSLADKAVPVAGDVLIIEDSADSYNKKKVEIGNLPGGGGTTFALPYYLDNTISQFAALTGNTLDMGWTMGTNYLILEDGTNTVYVKVENLAGSQPTKTSYDAGGGVGFNLGLFGNIFTLNTADGDLLINPHWEKFDVAFDPMFFGIVYSIGSTLYLEHTGARHDIVDGRPVQSAKMNGVTAGDIVTLQGVDFTAVGGGANPSLQQFNDEAASGSAAATATSLALTINNAASDALISAALGTTITATVHPTDTDVVMCDAKGVHFTLTENTGSFTILPYVWDDLATALAVVPGADLS